MKSWSNCLLFFTLVLAACGNNTLSDDNTQPVSREIVDLESNEEEVSDSLEIELTVEDILERSFLAMSEVRSYTTEMNLNQELSFTEGETMRLKMDVRTDLTLDPVAIYQHANISSNEAQDETLTTEQYMTSQGMFIYDEAGDGWIKYPEDFTEELLSLQEMQVNPEEQINMLNDFSSQMSYVENDTFYVLSLIGEGDEIRAFANQMTGMYGDEFGVMMDEMFGALTIRQLEYTIYVRKDTYLQEQVELDMEMAMQIDGEEWRSTQKMFGKMYNYNEVPSIEVPEDVKKSAEEVNEAGLELDDFFDHEMEPSS